MTRALSWIPLHDEVGVAGRILHQLENHTRKLECVAEDRAAFSQAKERLESGETMNSKLVVKVVTLFTIVLTVSIFASAQASYCNDRLIAGVYGFTLEGTKLAGPPGTPIGSQVGVAMTQFDGKGSLTQIDSVTIGGVAVSDFTHSPANGTYTVNSDCTGSFQLVFTDGRPPVTADFVVVEGGLEIDTVVTSAGGKQGILATRSIGKRRSFAGIW